LPGVTVVVAGTTTGTVTNADGNFSLTIPENAEILQFSFVGMRTQEVPIEGRTTFTVVMEEESIGIDEVVAIGYGTVRKSDLTGSVKSVNVEELTEMPNVSVIQGMQGTVPGLNVGAIDQAGQNPTLSIRGQNTLSSSAGDNAPLIVVDGIIYRGSIVDLNASDIESIDILKDASSAAIYGSQASNGVMIITTKKGKDIGKPIISYQGSYTLQVPSNKLEPMNGEELTNFLNDLFWNQGSRLGPDYIQPNPDFSFIPYFRNSQIANNFSNGIENDWWDLLTGNGSINSHNISLRGRNESLNYFLSGGLTDVDGFMKNENYRRINYRINLDAKVVDWMNVGLESFFTTSDYSGVSPRIGDSFVMYPWAPIYDENGEYTLTPDSRGLNPFLEMQQDDSDKRTNLFANIHSDIKLPFIKGFNYRINFSQNYRTTNQDRFNPWGANYTGSGYKNSYINYDWSLDNIITYKKLFKEHHNIDITLVYGIEERQYSYTQSSAQNFTNPLLGYNRLQAGDPSLNSITSGKEKENSLYTMGRLFYNYKDKYLITGTIRRDGFSGFGATKKIGVFPSIALGWVLSEENFMQDITDWLNYLKIRTSFGSSGRRAVGRYDTQAIVSSHPSVVFGDGGNATLGQWISSLANDNLGWETTTGLNIGIDYSIINSRVFGNVEYYLNDTKDILYNIQLPTMTGFNQIATNIGKVHNWGIEFELTGQIFRTGNFRWESSVNFSRNRNEIISVLGPENDQDGDGREDDLIANNLFIGESQNVNYNYEVIGIWQLSDRDEGIIPSGFEPGNYKLADLNDDGKITATDDRKILGYQDPSYRMGFTNNFSYKNFGLYVFINTIQGGKNYYQANLSFGTNPWHKLDQLIYSNPPKGGWDYWMPENTDAKYRRPDNPSQLGLNTGPHEQRNFVRLQDVSLSYSFNKSLIQKWDLSSLKFFISGKNLLTLTKWEGWDPETGVGFEPGRPVMTNFSLGINVEF
jgi:TonB-linked SusC/RagA family outer membrane protein